MSSKKEAAKRLLKQVFKDLWHIRIFKKRVSNED